MNIGLLPLNMIMSYPSTIQLLYFALSFVVAVAGWNKKMGFWGYLFVSILLSPLIGLMMVLVSGEKAPKSGRE